MARALSTALRDARLHPEDIDYLNAHGTATAANDASEWRAIQHVFGARAGELPVSSSKSFLGHAQGAAGALESVVTLLAMGRGKVPQTTNYSGPRPNSPADPVASPTPRTKPIRHAVSANAAFGGANAALVFARAGERRRDERRRRPRPVSVAAVGIALDEKMVSQHVPRVELRNTDASARLLGGAVAATLAEARIRPRTRPCEGIGLFAAQPRISRDSVDAFDKSVRERGRTHLSAPAFTRMVVNYGTGATCRLFGLKGPAVTLSTAADGGLTAFVLGVDHLAWRDEIDALLTAAVDDSDDDHSAAASVLLTARSETRRNGEMNQDAEGFPATNGGDEPLFISGWALGSEGIPAAERALQMSGRCRSEVTTWPVASPAAPHNGAALPFLGGFSALTSAISALRKGTLGPILVATPGAAVVLE